MMVTDLVNLPSLEPVLVADVDELDGFVIETRAELAQLSLHLRVVTDEPGGDQVRAVAPPEPAEVREPASEPDAVAETATIILGPGDIPAAIPDASRTSLFRRLYLDTFVPLLLVLVVLVILLALIG